MVTEREHTVRGPSWTVTWWAGDSASTAAFSREEATRAVVAYFGGFHRIEFMLPDQGSQLDDTLALLERAHEGGKAARSREIFGLLTS